MQLENAMSADEISWGPACPPSPKYIARMRAAHAAQLDAARRRRAACAQADAAGQPSCDGPHDDEEAQREGIAASYELVHLAGVIGPSSQGAVGLLFERPDGSKLRVMVGALGVAWLRGNGLVPGMGEFPELVPFEPFKAT